MNVDGMLATLNRHGVEYLLIGGVNFLLRHLPYATFDVDIWIEDSPDNRARCVAALVAMNAEWGATEDEWGPVSRFRGDWLAERPVYCVLTQEGPLDVFRAVKGLADWRECRLRSYEGATPGGVPYRGLSDEDMLACQLALEEIDRRLDRTVYLLRLLGRDNAG